MYTFSDVTGSTPRLKRDSTACKLIEEITATLPSSLPLSPATLDGRSCRRMSGTSSSIASDVINRLGWVRMCKAERSDAFAATGVATAGLGVTTAGLGTLALTGATLGVALVGVSSSLLLLSLSLLVSSLSLLSSLSLSATIFFFFAGALAFADRFGAVGETRRRFVAGCFFSDLSPASGARFRVAAASATGSGVACPFADVVSTVADAISRPLIQVTFACVR